MNLLHLHRKRERKRRSLLEQLKEKGRWRRGKGSQQETEGSHRIMMILSSPSYYFCSLWVGCSLSKGSARHQLPGCVGVFDLARPSTWHVSHKTNVIFITLKCHAGYWDMAIFLLAVVKVIKSLFQFYADKTGTWLCRWLMRDCWFHPNKLVVSYVSIHGLEPFHCCYVRTCNWKDCTYNIAQIMP